MPTKLKINIKQSLSFQILFQLSKEFFIPLLISASWTIYNKGDKNTLDLLQEGIVHFFAVAWAFSQWNRVKKQIRTEQNITGVGDDVRALLGKIEEQANHIAGYSTGGDSFCVAEFLATTGPLHTIICLRHQGLYPIFDVTIEVIDNNLAMDEYMSGKNHINPRPPHYFPSIYTKEIKLFNVGNDFEIDDYGIARVIFKYKSRAGDFRQDLMAALIEGKWEFATRLVKNHDKIFEEVSDSFPRNEEGGINWYRTF